MKGGGGGVGEGGGGRGGGGRGPGRTGEEEEEVENKEEEEKEEEKNQIGKSDKLAKRRQKWPKMYPFLGFQDENSKNRAVSTAENGRLLPIYK